MPTNTPKAAPTFCKCTCFKNSTIVALGPQHNDDNTAANPPRDLPPSDLHRDSKRAASSSCSQCTKAFCLSRGIDFCRDATEENVIVWGFLLGTTGLLGWAAFKRAQELREGKRQAEAAQAGRGRGDYSPLQPATN
ncbi:unnamed protein product [Colletotrichum noveboracense]|uniref:Uncharacterized protein n=1 Tax=Colletotrichum noveboracense TaxID=2664923 RepID=A0A9W4S9D6_9PEZI|nr:unnamed protein product [Colletotrichum noveboracense]